MWRLVPSSWVHGSGGHSHMPLELIMGVDIALEVLTTAIRAEKEIKGIQIGKEEVKLTICR